MPRSLTVTLTPAPERRPSTPIHPLNCPMSAGTGDREWLGAVETKVIAAIERFDPGFVLISAGFDAHERDPLGGMRLSTEAFAAMTMELRVVAEECCGGRIALVTEGGYDLHALAASLDAVADVLNRPVSAAEWPASGIDSDRGRSAADVTTRALAPFWRF